MENEIKELIKKFEESGLVHMKKYHSVDVALSQHHNIFDRSPRDLEFEYSIYGFNVEAGQNVLGTGSSFDNAMIDYQAQVNRLK